MSVICTVNISKIYKGKLYFIGKALRSSIFSICVGSNVGGICLDENQINSSANEIEISENTSFPLPSDIDEHNALIAFIISPIFFINIFVKARAYIGSKVLIFRGTELPNSLLKAFIKAGKAYEMTFYVIGDNEMDYSIKTIEQDFPDGFEIIIDWRLNYEWKERISLYKQIAAGGTLLQSNLQGLSEPEIEYLSQKSIQIGYLQTEWIFNFKKFGVLQHAIKEGVKLLQDEKIEFSNIELNSF